MKRQNFVVPYVLVCCARTAGEFNVIAMIVGPEHAEFLAD